MRYANNYQNKLETYPEILIKELSELKLKIVDTAVKYKNKEMIINDNDVFDYMLLRKKLIGLDLSKIPENKNT